MRGVNQKIKNVILHSLSLWLYWYSAESISEDPNALISRVFKDHTGEEKQRECLIATNNEKREDKMRNKRTEWEEGGERQREGAGDSHPQL